MAQSPKPAVTITIGDKTITVFVRPQPNHDPEYPSYQAIMNVHEDGVVTKAGQVSSYDGTVEYCIASALKHDDVLTAVRGW